MKTKHMQEYTVPEVEVIEIKASQIACSSGGTTDYNDGGNTEDDWF